MVGSYYIYVVEPYCGQSSLELVPITFVSRCLLTHDYVSPNVMLLIQYYGLYHLFQDSETFPLARVHQTTCVLSAAVSLSRYGRRARLSPRAMTPSTKKKNLGLANRNRWMR